MSDLSMPRNEEPYKQQKSRRVLLFEIIGGSKPPPCKHLAGDSVGWKFTPAVVLDDIKTEQIRVLFQLF